MAQTLNNGESGASVRSKLNALVGESNASVSKLAGIETGATADQTAAEILTAIKTVDGAASGLDADLLDGQQATDFAAAVHSHADVTAGGASGFMSGADKTKLNAIEAGATADQTAAEIETAYNSRVAVASSSEMTTGTETAVRRVSPDLIRQAIAAQAAAGGIGSLVEDTSPELGGTLDGNGNTIFDYTTPTVAGVSGALTQAAHGGRPCHVTGTVTVPVTNGFTCELANKSGSPQTVQPASGNLIHEGTNKASISLPNLRAVAVRGDGTDVWVYGALA